MPSLLRSWALLEVAGAWPAGMLLVLLFQGHRLCLRSITGWTLPLLPAICTPLSPLRWQGLL